ncbi:MAG TPA: hypothetical protein VK807_01510 [Gemmatimonadaceae bacterium]|nr:hypothetical protein [Gemmatimonadaceae bacterium]
MLRLFVSVSLAMILVACSDAITPTVTRQLEAAVSTPNSTIPFLPGARVSVLTVLDGTIWDAVALNDLGEVVGWGNNGSGTSDQTFQWTAHYGLNVRGSGVYEDSNASMAVSVNNSAQVLFLAAYARMGIWDWQGNARFLRPLSSFNPGCTPWQINDAGVSVGGCTAGGLSLATVWTKSGTPSALFVNGGSTPVQVDIQYPLEISDSNYIAGPMTQTGFVFTPTKQLRVLSFPTISGFTVNEVRPLAVNNHGQAVGFASTLGGGNTCFRRAIAWLTPGVVTDLGFCGSATGITDDATIFATREDSATGAQWAVVRTNAGVVYRLPGLEGGAALNEERSSVEAVNHVGKALGGIVTSASVSHTVIWTLPAL